MVDNTSVGAYKGFSVETNWRRAEKAIVEVIPWRSVGAFESVQACFATRV